MSEPTIAENGYQLVEGFTTLGGNAIVRAMDANDMPIAAALHQKTGWLLFVYSTPNRVRLMNASVTAQTESDALLWLNYIAALHVQAARAVAVAA